MEEVYYIEPSNYCLTKSGKVYSNFNKKVYPKNNYRELSQDNRNGYPSVRIDIKNGKGIKHYTVHRLMAEKFLPKKENYDQVNHINGNKTDNRLKNLEWSNSSHNMYHAYKKELMKPQYNRKGMIGKLSKTNKEVIEYNLGGDVIRVYESLQETKESGYRPSSVSKNCKGLTKTYKNRVFKFK